MEIFRLISRSKLIDRLEKEVKIWSEPEINESKKDKQERTLVEKRIRNTISFFQQDIWPNKLSNSAFTEYASILNMVVYDESFFLKPYAHLSKPFHFGWGSDDYNGDVYYLLGFNQEIRTRYYFYGREIVQTYCDPLAVLYWDYLIDDLSEYNFQHPLKDDERYDYREFGYLNYQESLTLLFHLDSLVSLEKFKEIDKTAPSECVAIHILRSALKFVISINTGIVSTTD